MVEVCMLSLCVVGRVTAAQHQPAAGGREPPVAQQLIPPIPTLFQPGRELRSL